MGTGYMLFANLTIFIFAILSVNTSSTSGEESRISKQLTSELQITGSIR